MPQRHGTDGLVVVDPAGGDQEGIADGPRAVHVEAEAAGGSASGSQRRQGQHVMSSARTAAAPNRMMSSTQRDGQFKPTVGCANAGVVADAREPVDKLSLRTRAEGGRKRRTKAK